MRNAKPADKMKYMIWLVENDTLSPPHSLSAQNGSSAKLLAGRTHGSMRLLGDSFGALFNADYRGAVDGLDDGGQATAQVVGLLVDMDFGWVFKNYCLS